jgi:hypothetical protein
MSSTSTSRRCDGDGDALVGRRDAQPPEGAAGLGEAALLHHLEPELAEVLDVIMYDFA